jgi:flavin reductase (DIM6/NTAB) family NADH-FMN oxidoreductase RutF
VVKEIVELGTHHMFISDVVNVSVNDRYLNENDAFSFAKANPLVYSHGHYYGIGDKIGKFGWSVEKKKGKKRN